MTSGERSGDNAKSPSSAPNPKRQKDESVETLRGLAIMFMVAGHVIGFRHDGGLRVDDDSFWRYAYESVDYLPMPLFTVISGYIYSMRPVVAGRTLQFFSAKVRRILIPMASVATLEFLTRVVMPGINKPVELTDIWRIYILPFDHFWFLQAIFLVFLAGAVFDLVGAMKTRIGWVMTLLLGILVSRYAPRYAYFSFNGFTYLLPYFVLGCGLYRYPGLLTRPSLKVVTSIAFVLAVIFHQLMLWDAAPNAVARAVDLSRWGILALIVGVTGNIVLFRHRFPVRWLVWLGGYAYTIYLFHVFGTAGSRILVKKLGITDRLPVFFIALAAGLLVPVAADLVLRQNKWTRRIFLGMR